VLQIQSHLPILFFTSKNHLSLKLAVKNQDKGKSSRKKPTKNYNYLFVIVLKFQKGQIFREKNSTQSYNYKFIVLLEISKMLAKTIQTC